MCKMTLDVDDDRVELYESTAFKCVAVFKADPPAKVEMGCVNCESPPFSGQSPSKKENKSTKAATAAPARAVVVASTGPRAVLDVDKPDSDRTFERHGAVARTESDVVGLSQAR